MLTVLKSFISANLMRILAVLLAVLAALGVLLGARKAGRSAEKAEQLARQVKLTRQAREIEDENRRTLADGDAARKLRESWSRKNGQ